MKVLWSAFILACAAIVLLSCEKIPPYQEPPLSGNNYVIDVGALKEKLPVFYSVLLHDKRVSFFVVMVNGEVQAYFNACQQCYSRKLGFRVGGGCVVCRSCSGRYPIEALKEGIASCYPIHLKGTLNDHRYLITRDTLEAGEKFF
jgi:uncharacterized membrane protein